MRVLVYCKQPSDSAMQLVRGLREAGMCARRMRDAHTLRDGDKVVCWGSEYTGGVNSAPPVNKLQELEMLSAAGVYVPPFSRTPMDGYVPRSLCHQRGQDLLDGCVGAYWTKRMDVAREYRVHVADGLSIKVGVKRVRVGNGTHHPWVRSHLGGWGIYYDGNAREGFNDKGRQLAKRAVEVLGLRLAAVDLWKLEDGSWCVGEVNRRPGLEAGSGVLRAYVKAVGKMVGVEVTVP